jgi:hypothetical protein
LKVDGRDPQNLPPEGSHVWNIKRWLDVGSGESKAKGILFFEYGCVEAVIFKIWKYTPHKRAIL